MPFETDPKNVPPGAAKSFLTGLLHQGFVPDGEHTNDTGAYTTLTNDEGEKVRVRATNNGQVIIDADDSVATPWD